MQTDNELRRYHRSLECLQQKNQKHHETRGNAIQFLHSIIFRFHQQKNSFVDESGKLLNGEIELRYREFHDAFDFFVAGIPMTYDSAGVRYQFASAGMMEMQAYQNGKKVNMATGKSINIELASNYKGTEYNLYKLDRSEERRVGKECRSRWSP